MISRLVLACAAIAGLIGVRPSVAAMTARHLSIDIVVAADGTYTEDLSAGVSTTDPAQAQHLGQLPLPFNPSLEQLDILEAYTLKPDGTRKEVDAAAIKTELMPAVQGAPMFSDVQQKVVIYPDLQAADTREIRYRRRVIHPLFPGQFTWWMSFNRAENWRDVRVTISAPSQYKLMTENDGVIGSIRTEGDQTYYEWHYAAAAQGTERYGVDGNDRRPRFFVSSFPNYAAMAAAYEALAAPKEAVTPAIQARADKITAGMSGKLEKARALYDWVSQHIRYVAIYLNRGGVEPHAADTVLANAYGDCKDHVALLGALLKAEGIESHAVLVNAGESYTLSEPPTLAQLNHVLTYIPDAGGYVDSTIGVAPFGVLGADEYGKQAVVVGQQTDVLVRLPLPVPEQMQMRTETEAELRDDGTITGTTVSSGTGWASIVMRVVGRRLRMRGGGAEDLAEKQLAGLGETGTGSFAYGGLDTLTDDAKITGTFNLDPQPELLAGQDFALPLGLAIFREPGIYLLGQVKGEHLPESEPVPCLPGQQIEDIRLTLPPHLSVARLPEDRQVDSGPFHFASRWSLVGQMLAVHREVTSRINEPLCEGAVRAEANRLMRLIRQDLRAEISLVKAAD